MPITIELDRGRGPYTGGDIIIGKVVVINSSEKSRQLSKDLTITFIGKAWTQWKEGRNKRDNLRQCLVSRWEIETYFNQSFLLIQPGNHTATRVVEPGVTELPFIYQLPPNLPNSFSSKHGGVVYTAQVLYKRPWKWDKVVQRDIYVQGSYSLGMFPMSTQPGYFTLVKKVWCRFGKIKANMLISKRGFVPGEEIAFKLELENDTRLQLKKIRVYLLQVTTYFAQTSSKQEMKKCCKLKFPAVISKQQLSYPGSFFVPEDLAPTNLGCCRIVQPRYSLLLKIKIGFFGKTCFYSVLEGRVPISIGTPDIRSRPARPVSCHIRPSSVINYPISFDTMRIAGSSTSSISSRTNLPLLPWNICSYNNDIYDSDPPPSYEDALSLPRPLLPNSTSHKYLLPVR